MSSNNASQAGKMLVARLLTPAEVVSVAGADFTTHGQSSAGYCQFQQTSGGFPQTCPVPTKPSA